MNPRRPAFFHLLISGLSILTMLLGVIAPTAVLASHTTDPNSVTIAGSLQSEIGCAGDWNPACAASHLGYDTGDDVWQGSWAVPAGSWEYKAALNDSWDENYGMNAAPGGGDISFTVGEETQVKFYYDHKSHWVTSNQNSVIATVPGSFQSELGCPGDWQPDCLRSWLQDPDGDGTYALTTTEIPAGNYEGKVAIDENWDVNYGQGGEQNGPNLFFNVPADDLEITFSYNTTTHILNIQVAAEPGFGHDNDIAWDGLRHDSRDTLYRTPGGAVPAGSEVLLRFRTFHNDVTGVSVRLFDLNANGQRILPMTLAAEDVSCYQPGLESFTCDFWQVSLTETAPNNLWYRFLVSDGSDTDYYADNTPALDGGLGATTDDAVDQSYALMYYDPSFTAPAWAASASIYQIFPDRFRDGRANNNPKTGDVRYDDPVIKLPWGTLPEGFCRNYADGSSNCPWRFDATPPDWSPTQEQPRGRDYFGGDLRGVDQYLSYLQALGVNTIYFNPIFDAGSNHSYDTQDYYRIDPYFGTQTDWENLVRHADQRGMRIVLDGVFNHMSSDSPFFDRYGHYPTVGACESLASPYRDWFNFHDVPAGTGSCAGADGLNSANYDGWFGFDSIPVINKNRTDVQAYFLTGENSVSRYWLEEGASGWRMDVSGDPSFPAGYWETFRDVTKSTDPDALLISETWQKDSTLLRMIRGDRLDTTMNYRLRDAVIGLLAPQGFDPKGFADSGRVILPSEFAARLESIREDYPDAAYYSLMNLLDSHDTERLRWTLTPGTETTAAREQNAANVAEGKLRQRLASLIQFTVPGAPTVFYGDEVGMTGDDDPDDRRTYPWADKGGSPDQSMFAHYQTLNDLRSSNDVLAHGDFKILLADDTSGVVAFGRKTNSQAAVIIINRSGQEQSGPIPVAGYLPDGIALTRAYAVGTGSPGTVTVTGGTISGSVGPLSAVVLISGNVDLLAPAVPTDLHVTEEGDGTVSLAWNSAAGGATGYNVYRSPLSGGGWVQVNDALLTSPEFTDTGLRNATTYYYVVTALDAGGNESTYSNEVTGVPQLTIGWANLQWPPTLAHTISVTDRTDDIYGQVWIDGVTEQPGATEGLRAQVGFGPDGSDPDGNADWIWVEAAFNVDAGNNDEFRASLLPEAVGEYDHAYRYSTTDGRNWIYADFGSGTDDGYDSANAGALTVNASSDTVAPAVPAGLHVVSASPAGIELAWDDVTGDASLYGYEVLRSETQGGPHTMIARITGSSYTDTAVAQGATYYYVVRSLDQSFNRSANSEEVPATAQLRTVTVTFRVTVPEWTPPDKTVHIAGTLSRLGDYPDWNSSAVALSPSGPNQWSINFTAVEGTQIEYKYTLGGTDFFDVEKNSGCGEIGNRLLTLSYGSDGTQTVNDAVLNWRNVAPCGN